MMTHQCTSALSGEVQGPRQEDYTWTGKSGRTPWRKWYLQWDLEDEYKLAE